MNGFEMRVRGDCCDIDGKYWLATAVKEAGSTAAVLICRYASREICSYPYYPWVSPVP